MTFRCEDLREHGLNLVPNTSLEYDSLLEDIQRRLGALPPEMPRLRVLQPPVREARPTSTILLNQSGKTIVQMELVWSEDGEVRRTQRWSFSEIVRFPDVPASTPMDYWRHILAGSKRYIGEDGVTGVNLDVRPPATEEIWKGGSLDFGSGKWTSRDLPIQPTTLLLRGVFFEGGEFAGSEVSGIWERAVTGIAAWKEIGEIFREGNGFERVDAFTGSLGSRPPQPRDISGHALWSCAVAVAHHRALFGDEGARERLISYITTGLPELRRL